MTRNRSQQTRRSISAITWIAMLPLRPAARTKPPRQHQLALYIPVAGQETPSHLPTTRPIHAASQDYTV